MHSCTFSSHSEKGVEEDVDFSDAINTLRASSRHCNEVPFDNFFHFHSNWSASLQVGKPETYPIHFHVSPRLTHFPVYNAPPFSSQLCCRIRRSTLYVAPTYVFLDEDCNK
jgi:hypothetical protein